MLFTLHFVFATAIACSSVGVYSLPLRDTPGGSDSIRQPERLERRSTGREFKFVAVENEPEKKTRNIDFTEFFQEMVAQGNDKPRKVRKAGVRLPDGMTELQLTRGLSRIRNPTKEGSPSDPPIDADEGDGPRGGAVIRPAREKKKKGKKKKSHDTDAGGGDGPGAVLSHLPDNQHDTHQSSHATDPPPHGPSSVHHGNDTGPTASTSQSEHQHSHVADSPSHGPGSAHHGSQAPDNGPAAHHEAPTASTSQSGDKNGKAPEAQHPRPGAGGFDLLVHAIELNEKGK